MAAKRRPPTDSKPKAQALRPGSTPAPAASSAGTPGASLTASASHAASAARAPSASSAGAAGVVSPSPAQAALRKPAAKPAAGDGKARKSSRSGARRSTVTPEQRHAMVAEGAYLRAERRGFVGGDAVSDWLAAEREVDELLGANVTNSAQ